MRLEWLESRFRRRIDLAEQRLGDYLQRTTKPLKSGAEIHEIEGWLSDVWQTWGRFCRRTVVSSCTGFVLPDGSAVSQSHPSVAHVSFVAVRQKKGVAPAAAGENYTLRYEPTWGHVDRLLEVIQALGPANAGKLASAFGTVPAIEHVRLIRNCAAHINHETFAEVVALQPQYIATPITHPVEALFWTVPTTGKTLIHARLDEMRICARNVCR